MAIDLSMFEYPGQTILMYDKITGQPYMGTAAALASGRWTLEPPSKVTSGGSSTTPQKPQQSTPTAQYSTPTTQTSSQTSSLEQAISKIYSMMPKTSYADELRNLYSQMPKYTPKSTDEIIAEATKLADLQINPLIEAINRRIREAETTASGQRKGIEAAYANVGTEAQRLLSEAEKRALESAIARGGGRSGAVEYTTRKLSEPIMSQVAQSEAEKAAKLSSIEEALGTYKTNAMDELTSLQERRGALIDTYRETLRRQEEALAQGNFAQASQLAGQLAEIERQTQDVSRQMMLDLLPYFSTTAAEQAKINLDWTDLMGEVPGDVAGRSTSPITSAFDSMINLRDISGLDVDYKQTGPQTVGGKTYHGNVIINGKEYTPQQLIAMGAVFDFNTQRWKIPRSMIHKLPA
jgi:hypothetical protein